MSRERVMLLIDADNVSVGVMEQAVAQLTKQHGALHVRRAYCTAQSAVKHESVFKRLGIKPMVNLAAGKNSTDIALAVDAMDLVLAERPDVVVIASSDSDFAPLVLRLRERGCVVRGIGQLGKTGDETRGVYDDYTEFEHKLARAPSPSSSLAAPVVRTTRLAGASRVASVGGRVRKRTLSADDAPEVLASDAAARLEHPAAPAPATAAPANAARVAKPRGRVAAVRALDPGSVTGRSSDPLWETVLACLPELSKGQALALNVAVQRLREAQVLGKNRSSAKLFEQLSPQLEMLPAKNPTQVRLRRA